jgi:hypothetical protein
VAKARPKKKSTSLSGDPELLAKVEARVKQLGLKNRSVYLTILAWNDLVKADATLAILPHPEEQSPVPPVSAKPNV